MSRISKVEIDHVRDLWKSVSGIGGRTRRERRLRSLLERTVGVSDPFFWRKSRRTGDREIRGEAEKANSGPW